VLTLRQFFSSCISKVLGRGLAGDEPLISVQEFFGRFVAVRSGV